MKKFRFWVYSSIVKDDFVIIDLFTFKKFSHISFYKNRSEAWRICMILNKDFNNACNIK